MENALGAKQIGFTIARASSVSPQALAAVVLAAIFDGVNTRD
jgi:hypothetical protein